MIISFLVDTDELENIEDVDNCISDLEEALAALKSYRVSKVVSTWTHRRGNKVYKMNYSSSLIESIEKADKEYIKEEQHVQKIDIISIWFYNLWVYFDGS